MSSFFKRVAELIVGQNKWTYPELHMSYKVPFDYTNVPTISEISIYNLSAASIAELEVGQQIVFNAGYEGDIGTVLSGVVKEVFTEKEGSDIKTTIRAINVTNQYLDTNLNTTYAEGTAANFIILDILKYLGLSPNLLQLKEDIIYPNGLSVSGKVIDILTEVVEDCGSTVIIRNSSIEIMIDTEGIETGYLLSSETGLLNINKIDKSTNFAQYKVEMLLNHAVQARSLLQIDSVSLEGIVMALQGSHEDWKTTVEVYPVG